MTDYNGWTNRGTWLVNLHFEENLALDIAEYLEQTDNIEDMTYNDIIDEVASFIEQFISDFIEEQNLNIFIQDLLEDGDINYRELARHYVYDEIGDEDDYVNKIAELTYCA